MVGEIQDGDAQIAIQSALTGHPFTTVHANNVITFPEHGRRAVSVRGRLPLAQRLVRRICDHCGARRKSRASVIESADRS
jgi:general secretion pathway protein E